MNYKVRKPMLKLVYSPNLGIWSQTQSQNFTK